MQAERKHHFGHRRILSGWGLSGLRKGRIRRRQGTAAIWNGFRRLQQSGEMIVDPGCLRKGWGIMGFLKNNPKQSSRAYPILSDVSGFPGSKIGDTFDSCNIGHGPLKRCGSSGVHPLALDRGTLWLWTRLGGADKLGSNMRGGKTHRRHTGPMLSSPRCRARTCSGKPCRSAAVRGKRRCMAVPPVPALLQAILRPVHARSSCGIKTAAQCLQAIARAPATDVVSDAPRPRNPTAATSSARVRASLR
jgi:hypothetical protein